MPRFRATIPLLAAALPLCLAAQAPQAGRPGKGAAGPQAASAPQPGAPQPGALKPFADIIKDAKETKGFFPIWQKDDKVWLEIRPEQLEQPFFFSISSVTGIGERGIYGGMMDGSHLATFRRVNNSIQFLALNTDYTADSKLAIARAVREGFSDSLMGSAAVLCQPHPERKSVLIELNSLLIADLPMTATQLEATYRQPYAFDRGNSYFQKVRATEDQDAFVVNAHYALQRMMLPQPGMPPMLMPSTPRTLEDPRSLFMAYHYSFARLPEKPMAPRYADDRVGYFATTRWDWSDDLQPSPRKHVIHRWRLEKKDPGAAVSEPVQPIVYWLDRNMPEKYRKVVEAGILEWNKAFEKAGFKDAIQVKVQPDDAEWDTHDARHACIRWLVGTDVGFAIGPSQVDPRTGEILDADIGISEVWTRGSRREFLEALPRAMQSWGMDETHVQAAAQALQELDFATDLLEARGELAPDGPEVEAYIMAVLKDVVTHEVGHTFGLRHNFRASTVYTQAQLDDPSFTRVHGISNSVMDYHAMNIALKGGPQGEFVMSTLGPYDYFAIEYGYKPLPADKEAEGLAAIAGRADKDPLLTYATDEDAGGYGPFEGMDPTVNRRDLGSDPLAYYKRRIQLSHELWDRLQAKTFKDGENFVLLRRNVDAGLAQMALVTNLAAKYIGGVSSYRDHAGGGHLPLEPTPAPRQREALKLLEAGLFNADSFRFKPEFMAKLVPDRNERGVMNPDYSLSLRVLSLQRAALTQLLQAPVLQRIQDSGDKLKDPRQAFRMSELFDMLQGSVWSELKGGKDPVAMRRNLQREHLRQLAGLVLKPQPGMPEDARSLAREGMRSLQGQLKAAGMKPGLSRETKAHYAECVSMIEETLKAGLQRGSF